MSDAFTNPDLAALDDVAAPDEPAAEQAAAGGPPPPLSNAQAIGFLLETFREVVCLTLDVQSPRTTLDAVTVRAIADAVAPVADKYGLELGSLMGNFGPELMAIAVAGPPLLRMYRALVDELEQRKAKAQADAAKVIDAARAPAPSAPPGPAADSDE